jgi:hypothetical protein
MRRAVPHYDGVFVDLPVDNYRGRCKVEEEMVITTAFIPAIPLTRYCQSQNRRGRNQKQANPVHGCAPWRRQAKQRHFRDREVRRKVLLFIAWLSVPAVLWLSPTFLRLFSVTDARSFFDRLGILCWSLLQPIGLLAPRPKTRRGSHRRSLRCPLRARRHRQEQSTVAGSRIGQAILAQVQVEEVERVPANLPEEFH